MTTLVYLTWVTLFNSRYLVESVYNFKAKKNDLNHKPDNFSEIKVCGRIFEMVDWDFFLKFKPIRFVVRLYQKAFHDDIFSRAAQVAFYFSFAIFPLLLFSVTLFGMILGSADDLRIELFEYLQKIMPQTAYHLVENTLLEVVQNSSGGKLLCLLMTSGHVD